MSPTDHQIRKTRQKRLHRDIFSFILGGVFGILVLRCLWSADLSECTGREQQYNAVIQSEVPYGLCVRNPYFAAFSDAEALRQTAHRAEEWLKNAPQHREASKVNESYPKELRHAWFHPYQPLFQCEDKNIHCIGGKCRDDVSKIVCGLSELRTIPRKQKCIIYSIGGHNQWQFERHMARTVPRCEIHTFDCTGPKSRFRKPYNSRIHFHHTCLGSEYIPYEGHGNCSTKEICGDIKTLPIVMEELNHQTVHLLKMDIEGSEWPIFRSWQATTENGLDKLPNTKQELPMQIVVEIHLHGDPMSAVDLAEHLMRVGYASVFRDDNEFCPTCSEITFLKYRC